MRRRTADRTSSRSAFCCTSWCRARNPFKRAEHRIDACGHSPTSRSRRSTTGCRRFRRRSMRSWRDCSRKILRRDINPSATSAAPCAACLVDLSPSATLPAADRRSARRRDGSARLIGRDAERAQVLHSLHAREVRPRQPRSCCSVRRVLARVACRRHPGRGAAARVPDAGRPMLRTGGHAGAHPVYRSPRGGLTTDAGRGISTGSQGERPGAGEADARAASSVSGHAAAAGAAAGAATAIPVHEHPRVPDTRPHRSCRWSIFIDDLQWADESTIQLTQHLAQQFATLPIVIVARIARSRASARASARSKGTLHSLLDRVRGQAREASRLRPSRRRSINSSASASLTRSCCAR